MTERKKRASSEEILTSILSVLQEQKVTTTKGIAKLTGLSTCTVEKYLGLIVYLQSQERIQVVKNSVGEVFYSIGSEVETREEGVKEVAK